MSKKRITADSVENPLEGSAFFILPPPLESENDEQLNAPEARQIPENEVAGMQVSETLEVQNSEAKTELANSLAVEANGKKEVATSKNLIAQENEAEIRNEQKSQQVKARQNSTKESAPRRRVGRPSNPRYTKRHSFELFADQMLDLRMLQARYEVKKGRKVALSEMVRDALDTYLKAKGCSHPMFRPEEEVKD